MVEAERQYRHAVKCDPKHGMAQYNLGWMLEKVFYFILLRNTTIVTIRLPSKATVAELRFTFKGSSTGFTGFLTHLLFEAPFPHLVCRLLVRGTGSLYDFKKTIWVEQTWKLMIIDFLGRF